ncbi:MAG: hypothetical protein K5857_10995 [Lachnospiraceae bacterium]|nr:hypothetical protein [Lachnospiraceae bacterium]
MVKRDMNLLLIKAFPELKKQIEEETDWQEGLETGSHVVYGDVFSPYIKKMKDEQNLAELERIFDFIESLCNSGDSYCEEVVVQSVLEGLIFDDISYSFYDTYMGEATKELVKNII